MGYIWLIVGGLLLWWLIAHRLRAPERALRARVLALGEMRGLSRAAIVLALGDPSRSEALADGRTALRWTAGGYQVMLVFTGARCDGMRHDPWAG